MLLLLQKFQLHQQTTCFAIQDYGYLPTVFRISLIAVSQHQTKLNFPTAQTHIFTDKTEQSLFSLKP